MARRWRRALAAKRLGSGLPRVPRMRAGLPLAKVAPANAVSRVLDGRARTRARHDAVFGNGLRHARAARARPLHDRSHRRSAAHFPTDLGVDRPSRTPSWGHMPGYPPAMRSPRWRRSGDAGSPPTPPPSRPPGGAPAAQDGPLGLAHAPPRLRALGRGRPADDDGVAHGQRPLEIRQYAEPSWLRRADAAAPAYTDRAAIRPADNRATPMRIRGLRADRLALTANYDYPRSGGVGHLEQNQ